MVIGKGVGHADKVLAKAVQVRPRTECLVWKCHYMWTECYASQVCTVHVQYIQHVSMCSPPLACAQDSSKNWYQRLHTTSQGVDQVVLQSHVLMSLPVM